MEGAKREAGKCWGPVHCTKNPLFFYIWALKQNFFSFFQSYHKYYIKHVVPIYSISYIEQSQFWLFSSKTKCQKSWFLCFTRRIRSPVAERYNGLIFSQKKTSKTKFLLQRRDKLPLAAGAIISFFYIVSLFCSFMFRGMDKVPSGGISFLEYNISTNGRTKKADKEYVE